MPRPRLTRERILKAAVSVADSDGLDALTMRRLGSELGVEAMSLYKHVANKDEILDGIVDAVVSEIELPVPGSDWKVAMRSRAHSAREVFARHSWAVGLYESRGQSGAAVLRYVDATLGTLRAGGFTVESAAHAFWILDCFVYGQVVQESAITFGASADMVEADESPLDQMMVSEMPHLVEMAMYAQQVNFTTIGEFEIGLDLILDSLEAMAGNDSQLPEL